MKHLGIDYGTKRIGLALSNQEGSLAFPKETILNSQNLIREIVGIIYQEDIAVVVIGKSLDAAGSENTVQRAITSFIAKLSQEINDINITEQDERGSSIAASAHLYGKGNIANEKWSGRNNAKKREHNDANAAAVILQRYLDKQRTK
ncbi:MAG: putative Holliday junction resolvase [Candidatus Paceibacteria bacterium]|jgi:putative Holliday junction resolvase